MEIGHASKPAAQLGYDGFEVLFESFRRKPRVFARRGARQFFQLLRIVEIFPLQADHILARNFVRRLGDVDGAHRGLFRLGIQEICKSEIL